MSLNGKVFDGSARCGIVEGP